MLGAVALLSAGMMLFVALSVTYARIAACRTDPVVILSNGAVVTMDADTQDIL